MGRSANSKSASSYPPSHELSIWWAWMGVTNWSSSTYQNRCIAALASLLMKHPHLWIDIPLPTPEEPECTTPPLGRVHVTPADTIPKTPWKPRITLMAEVNDLLNRGMVDDYNHESEHSTTGNEAATKAGIPPPQEAEVPAPPLDTSSQASVEEMETSLESNPINIYSTMATCSSRSDSPMADLTELQEDANLAANYMLSIKRSLDLKRQWAIRDCKALLHQQEAEEAVANEKAKIIHSRKNLDTKVGCTKAVMEAKYNYRMAIQNARMIRCNQLQELETAYLEALGENAAARSTQSARLHREHVKHMHKLEEQALREENKSCHDFLSACQAILLHALQPLRENLSTSYQILLGWLPSSLQSAPFTRTPQTVEQPSATTSPRPEPKQSPWPKRWHPLPRSMGKHVHGWDFLQGLTGWTVKLQKKRDSWLVCLPKAQSYRCLQPWLWPHERSQIALLCHPPLWLDPW